MEHIEKMSVKALYRGILKAVKTYPSRNRDTMRQAIIDDVNDWKLIKDPLEAQKAVKKMRMLSGHLTMWNTKMEEVNSKETERVDKPLHYKDMNAKKDKDFVYF